MSPDDAVTEHTATSATGHEGPRAVLPDFVAGIILIPLILLVEVAWLAAIAYGIIRLIT